MVHAGSRHIRKSRGPTAAQVCSSDRSYAPNLDAPWWFTVSDGVMRAGDLAEAARLVVRYHQAVVDLAWDRVRGLVQEADGSEER